MNVLIACAEYIEREAVNALIKAECSPKVAAYLIDAVAAIPAADVREVKRGKWIIETSRTYFEVRCSECGIKSYVHIEDEDTISYANFCPNCGADMREEQDGR